jgi:RNA polymerase sigma-70 factor (ECF subfamily)
MILRDPFARPEPLVRRVYAYAAYRLGDGPDAEDATQQTFERAYRYRSNYDPRKGAPIAWLLGIARHSCDDVLQARSPHAELDGVDVADAGDLEPRAVGRLDLREAVLALDDRSRDLIALRYGADLTARQIAELLGERTNAIEVALHRALGRLRAAMGDQVAAGEDAVRI